MYKQFRIKYTVPDSKEVGVNYTFGEDLTEDEAVDFLVRTPECLLNDKAWVESIEEVK